MKTYALARFLTDAQKRAMIVHQYVFPGSPMPEAFRLPDEEPVYRGLRPVSIEDLESCPLGYVPGMNVNAPSPGDASSSLLEQMDEWERITNHGWRCEAGLRDGQEGPVGCCLCSERFEDALSSAVTEFISAWDQCEIPPNQLAYALGVEL